MTPPADWRALNSASWNERTALHIGTALYDMATHRAGAGRLDAIVGAEIGPVAGLRVLHLQCHLGDDSIAVAQRGAAEVVGVDFSAPALAAARALAAECGTPQLRFVEADVLALPDALPGGARTFDLVFACWGTIGWLPDIAGWARVVAHHLRPGGAVYLADLHPVAAVFEGPVDGGTRPDWLLPYFARAPHALDDGIDYADPTRPLANSRVVNWIHPIADILAALRSAGLRLDWLHEHPRIAWQHFPGLVRDAERMWTWPDRPWLPLSFSLRAVKA